MPAALTIGVAALALWAAVGLVAQVLAARSYGQPTSYAVPAGSARSGVFYMLGPGMSPTAKESVRLHFGTWLAGVAYHAGVGTALACLLLVLGRQELSGPLLRMLQALLLVGTLGGLFLLGKRIVLPRMRRLSHPDDYVANLLTTVFVGLALARTVSPAVEIPWVGLAMLLFLYLPVGKIRHCFFFFATRVHAGTYFGRRGVLPPPHA